MVSLAARGNIAIEDIVDQLKSAGTCPSYAVRKATKNDTSKGSSCPVAIGYALTEMYNELQKELKLNNQTTSVVDNIKSNAKTEDVANPRCPKCGEELSMSEGCMTCSSCGYSKCN